MAIKQITGLASVGVPTSDVTQAGITHITQASAEASAGTVVRAKDGQGDIIGVLLGKKTISMSVSGYSSNATGATLNEDIQVGGVTGKVVSSTVEATTEDFTRFSADGQAIEGGIV